MADKSSGVRRSARKRTTPAPNYSQAERQRLNGNRQIENNEKLKVNLFNNFSSSDDNEEEPDEKLTGLKPKAPAFAVSSSGEDSEPESRHKAGEFVQYTHQYFIEQCIATTKKGKTVGGDKLNDEKLDAIEIQEHLKQRVERHVAQFENLSEIHCGYFDKFSKLMMDGFNILLYGVGSKKNLVEKFVREKLVDEFIVTVYGFFPGLTLKHVLNSITEEILKTDHSFSTPAQHADFIIKELTDSEIDVYIVIHNIDGDTLSNEKSFAILSQLAKCSRVHFLVTVDHINSSLLFDSVKLSIFNWVWFNVTTFAMYKTETSYENSVMLHQREKLELSSLQHVYKSLTPNAQNIFELLARNQLENCSDASFVGLSFAALFKECREGFFVNSELTLNAQLIEYKDHDMIRTKKGGDGLEYLYIPLDKKTLASFLEQLDE